MIFLDIDGVVVTTDSLKTGGPKCADARCVNELNRIVEAADAEIVISSSWRLTHSTDFIRDVLCGAGFRWPDRIIGVTEHMHYRRERGAVIGRAERSDEIRAWLTTNPRERFVVIDDEWEAEIPGHFVRTPSDRGLGAGEALAALEVLAKSRGPEL